MAKPDQPEQPEQPKSEIYILEQSFGAIMSGAHKCWAKGTEFIMAEESKLIGELHKLGAAIKLKL